MKATLAFDALRDAVEQLPNNRLAASRLAAFAQLEARGTPTTGFEDWKYTDLSAVIDISNQWLVDGAHERQAAAITAESDAITERVDAHWLVIANGGISEDSVVAAASAGIDVSLLSETDINLDFAAPLSDLNTALLRDGLQIRIAAGTKLDKPIGLLVVDDTTATVGVTQVRVEIDVAAHAETDLIEHHVSTGDAGHYANSVINLNLGENATVRYVRIQDRSHAHSQTGRLNVRLDRDSELQHCVFDFGGKLVRNDLNIELAGAGAQAAFSGLYIATGDQHIDNHTRVDHRVGPARSLQEYRGILAGRARCVWNGKAMVHVGADGTDAEQANHNLLLSEQAEIDAKPELEIYADDVKCSHGTTIGQLDENALYYLRTRGLSRRDAQHLMTQAFAQSIVDKSPISLLQETLREMVAVRLDNLGKGDTNL
jgi:Fe-S cluster assembly protein SufD